LPELANLDQLAERRRELDGERVENETSVSDLTRAQRKADGEVENVKARRQRDQQRMDSGQVASAKDLQSMQHEVTALDRRIRTLEDEELEVMETLEEAETVLTRVRDELGVLDGQVAQNEADRDRAFAELDGQAADTQAERELTAAKIPDNLLTLYEKVRAQHGGLGAAALRQRTCGGCRLELNGADLRELSALPSDEVLRCPECNRILVRTAESGT